MNVWFARNLARDRRCRCDVGNPLDHRINSIAQPADDFLRANFDVRRLRIADLFLSNSVLLQSLIREIQPGNSAYAFRQTNQILRSLPFSTLFVNVADRMEAIIARSQTVSTYENGLLVCSAELPALLRPTNNSTFRLVASAIIFYTSRINQCVGISHVNTSASRQRLCIYCHDQNTTESLFPKRDKQQRISVIFREKPLPAVPVYLSRNTGYLADNSGG